MPTRMLMRLLHETLAKEQAQPGADSVGGAASGGADDDDDVQQQQQEADIPEQQQQEEEGSGEAGAGADVGYTTASLRVGDASDPYGFTYPPDQQQPQQWQRPPPARPLLPAASLLKQHPATAAAAAVAAGAPTDGTPAVHAGEATFYARQANARQVRTMVQVRGWRQQGENGPVHLSGEW